MRAPIPDSHITLFQNDRKVNLFQIAKKQKKTKKTNVLFVYKSIFKSLLYLFCRGGISGGVLEQPTSESSGGGGIMAGYEGGAIRAGNLDLHINVKCQ